MTGTEVALLGPLRVRRDGRELPIAGRHARALLAYLALQPNRLVTRDALVSALWTTPPPTAAKIVQITVSQLRRALGDGVLESGPRGYRLTLDSEDVDVERFTGLAAQGRGALAGGRPVQAAAALEPALALVRGEALVDLDDEPFVAAQRIRLEELRLATTEDYAAALIELDRHADVVAELDALAREHPRRERLTALLMVGLYRSGRQADALAVYRETRARLVEDLGIEPGPELRRLERAILAQDPSLEAELEQPAHDGDLPVPDSPLFGREREVAALDALLKDPRTRLVTLTGPGGVGKTRLALEAARLSRPRFPDGVFFVPLDTVTDPELLVPTIARVLGVHRHGEGALRAHLARSSQLVVLDSFEQVQAAAPQLAELVAGPSQTTFLTTSRERLRVSAERELRVPPLASPQPGTTDVGTLARVPSVALFVERSQRLDPTFALSPGNAREVAEICRRLEGLPLSLELAAARTTLLTPGALLKRLTRRLDVLTSGSRDAPARHRTLRATIDWSLDLLDESERELLEQLSVFSGGWTLEAAEAVCGGDGDLLDPVSSMIDKSLIRREPGDELRFGMLDSIREYALERLRASGEEEATILRHRAHFTALAEAALHGFCGPDEGEWLDRLEVEHANVTSALESALTADDAETAYRLANSLGRFWLLRGYLQDGRRLLGETLARVSGSPEWRMRVLASAGRLASEQGDLEGAEQLFESSLALAQELGEQRHIAIALLELGSIALGRREYARARALLEESVTINRAAGGLTNVAIAVHQIAEIDVAEGDLTNGRAHFEESIAIARECESVYCLAGSLRGLAGVLLALNDLEPVAAVLGEGLRLACELGHRQGIAEAVEQAATLATARGEPATGALLLGASEAHDSIGRGRPAYQVARRERALLAAGANRGGRHFDSYQRGLALTLEDALDAARRVIGDGPRQAPAAEPEPAATMSAGPARRTRAVRTGPTQ